MYIFSEPKLRKTKVKMGKRYQQGTCFFPFDKTQLAFSCSFEPPPLITSASLKWWVAKADFKAIKEAVGWQLLSQWTCWLSLQKYEYFQIKCVNGSTLILEVYSHTWGYVYSCILSWVQRTDRLIRAYIHSILFYI